jgi:conjugal transfer/entry exclusion protein
MRTLQSQVQLKKKIWQANNSRKLNFMIWEKFSQETTKILFLLAGKQPLEAK